MQLCLFYPSLLALGLCTLGLGGSYDFAESICGAQGPGDILIGLPIPTHATVDERTQPEAFTCKGFDLVAFMRSLATIYTVEEINNRGFLPGVRLGYVMCDTCADATKALQSVNHMLAINGSLQVQCDYTEYRPKVKVMIGARYSEVSIAVAKQLSVYMLPQVSCTSSAPILSDKHRYPSFLRVIPSDVHQMQALAKLMGRFGWDWVGVVSGDDDYGKAALQSFLLEADKESVCVAYQEVVPHYLDHEHIKQRLKQVAQQIYSSKAQVVLLILKSELVEDLFQEMIRTNTSRIWIASDAWSRNGPLAHMDGINQVGDIFGFTFVTGKVPGFESYLKKLRPSPGGFNNFIKEYKNLRFSCTPELLKFNECRAKNPPSSCPKHDSLNMKSDLACSFPDPQQADDEYLVHAVDTTEAYSERLSVWAIAHALRELLNCNDTICTGEKNFPPWKLLEKLKKVNFTLDNDTFWFDKAGDFTDGYDLIMWVKDGNKRAFKVQGRFHILPKQMHVDMNNISWLSMTNKSRCSEYSCKPGFVKKVSTVSCCYTCNPCLEGTFSDSWDQQDCRKCPNGTWSQKGWIQCMPRVETYLRWSDPHPIALVAAAAFGVLMLISILIIFLVHRESQPMKRAEVKMSCAMMAGLAVSFASVICFMGKPNVHLCRARQIMYGIGFTLCVSCILVKAFRMFLAFLDPFERVSTQLKRLYKPPVIVTIVTAVQGIICIFWIMFDSPDIDNTPPSPQSMQIQLQCNEGRDHIGFGAMLSYIALLAFVGFLLAFKGRKVPQEFSETGYVIFSMLMYLFVWVCFIPIYILRNEQGSIVQASAILVSSYGIIFCHFLPKCYEALCCRDGNTAEKVLRRLRLFSSESVDSPFDNSSTDSGVITNISGTYPASQGNATPPNPREIATSTSTLESS